MQKPYLTNYNLLTTKDSWQVDNVAEGIHEVKGKYGHTNKKCETCEIKYKNCNCCLEYKKVKHDSSEHNFYVAIFITKKSLVKT